MDNHQEIFKRLDRADEHFLDHEKSDQRNFDSINDSLKRIEKTLEPISKTYDTAGTLWKWLMALAVLLSIAVGIITGLMKITGK